MADGLAASVCVVSAVPGKYGVGRLIAPKPTVWSRACDGFPIAFDARSPEVSPACPGAHPGAGRSSLGSCLGPAAARRPPPQPGRTGRLRPAAAGTAPRFGSPDRRGPAWHAPPPSAACTRRGGRHGGCAGRRPGRAGVLAGFEARSIAPAAIAPDAGHPREPGSAFDRRSGRRPARKRRRTSASRACGGGCGACRACGHGGLG